MRGKAETPRATAVRGERGGEGEGPTRNGGAWGTLRIRQRRHAVGRRMGCAADGAKTRGDGNVGRRGRANSALPYKCLYDWRWVYFFLWERIIGADLFPHILGF